MKYPRKEVQPPADHDNIDLILMGAVPYPEETDTPAEESKAELLRFMDIWVAVQDKLQPPVREDAEGMGGYTGYRTVVLDEADTPYALGFGLSANYGRTDTSMRVSAFLRRIYDEDARLERYESEEIHLYSGDKYDVNKDAQQAAARLEHLLGLYAAASALEETA